jgi:Co/Zn/Cd efflux system component
MADTMRSIAVLVAAAMSFFLNLSPELSDAVAAIIVSIIIAVSLGPLIVGLMKTWRELQIVRRELRLSKQQQKQQGTNDQSYQ